ncbi:hypothetical protein [uncultured Winogradskyella sp.]|uniref:hypothetical protein n=1 Tax=uncultured Winogradskyella sp. TaxID=395353 RepID=UPI002632DADA|nr:hypothetical protein [uncultured Winogradskyella sp.]
MKKNLKFLLLAPLLMAILCGEEGDDFPCASVAPEFFLEVENISESYDIDETIWIESEATSVLLNGCPGEDVREVLGDGIFVLKLTNQLENLNAVVVQNYNVIYEFGSEYNTNFCFEYISYVPEYSENELAYKFRLGISINQPGDYCFVNARDSYFNLEQENNSEIFAPYDVLNNTIKFNSCAETFTRNGTQTHYFFRVNP